MYHRVKYFYIIYIKCYQSASYCSRRYSNPDWSQAIALSWVDFLVRKPCWYLLIILCVPADGTLLLSLPKNDVKKLAANNGIFVVWCSDGVAVFSFWENADRNRTRIYIDIDKESVCCTCSLYWRKSDLWTCCWVHCQWHSNGLHGPRLGGHFGALRRHLSCDPMIKSPPMMIRAGCAMHIKGPDIQAPYMYIAAIGAFCTFSIIETEIHTYALSIVITECVRGSRSR